MKTPSLESRILEYLKKCEGQWIKKVSIYVLADEAGYSPETAGRLLRDLAESGKIKVSYYDGKYAKHLAKYSYNPVQKKLNITLEENKDGRLVAVLR